MPQSFLSTAQPASQFLAPAAASASYGSIAPTDTKPTTGVIYTPETAADPSLLRITPLSSVNNATGVGMRVVGWNPCPIPVTYTNLITYSQEFDNAAWIKSSLAVTGGSINASVAPDGTTTADNALETGATVYHYIGRDLTDPVASTTIRTHSVYVKGGLGRQYASICCGNGSGGPYYTVTVDLNTGSITQSDLVNSGTWFTTTPTATVTPVAGTGLLWYRVAITCRQVQYFLASPSNTATPTSGSNFGLPTYASDVTKGVVLWGGQVEFGTTASPYLATTTAAVTATNTTVPPVTAWFPTVLADLTLTYSTGTVAAMTVNNVPSYVFSNITQVALSPDASLYRPSTVTATATETASALIDTVGSQLVQVQFKASTGSMGAAWYSI